MSSHRIASDSNEGHPGLKLTGLIWALLFARWLTPAESTAEGGTLWLVLVTAITAAVGALSLSRSDRPFFYRDRWDRLVWAVVIAHVLSATLVIVGVGQKRLALNMLWEWTGVGLQFSLLRQTLLTSDRRRAFLQAAILLWSALAGFGVWQHYVFLPGQSAEYEATRAEFDELHRERATNQADAQRRLARIEEIRNEWVSQGVPLDGPAQGLFERRLRDSREPMAFFALANSLSGMLASSLMLLVAMVAGRVLTTKTNQLSAIAVPVVAGLLILLCLLLTKGRTAWAASFAAIGLWGAIEFARRFKWIQRVNQSTDGGTASSMLRVNLVAWVSSGVVVVAVLAGVVWKLGGLDQQVLTESSKSLSYRLQYWIGSSKIIAEHPWCGVGPGNFRSHYLRHKLANASEEIADPHSFVFDILTNAGLVGGVAFAALLIGFAIVAWRTLRDTDSVALATSVGPSSSAEPMGPFAILTSIGLVVVYEFLIHAQLNEEVLVVGGIAVVISLMQRTSRVLSLEFVNDNSLRVGATLAVVALLVHLLGAGGIASPAILGWLLALMAVVSFPQIDQLSNSAGEDLAQQRYSASPRALQIASVSYAFLALAVAKLGWLPMLQVDALLMQGNLAGQARGQVEAAREFFFLAHQADPLNPRPLSNLAQIEFAISESSSDESRFRTALEMAMKAESLDPFSGNMATEVGRWFSRRFLRTHSPDDARQAVEWLRKAVALYPTNSFWTAELAVALRDAGELSNAKEVVRQTLELQAINQQAGHLDRLLPEEVVRKIEAIQ